jgi:hypothetical protein
MKKFASRKFLVSLVTVVSLVASKFTGVELSEAEIISIASVVSVYLGGQSFVDSKNGRS